VTVFTKRSGLRTSAVRSSATPLNFVPSGSAPDASIGLNDSSTARQRPIASKFSRAKPAGSIMLWHDAQTGLARCCDMRARIVVTFACVR
jgi:hypothetical protein